MWFEWPKGTRNGIIWEKSRGYRNVQEKKWNKTIILNEYHWKRLKGHTGTRVSCDIQEEGDTITKSEKTGEKVPYELKIFSSHFFGWSANPSMTLFVSKDFIEVAEDIWSSRVVCFIIQYYLFPHKNTRAFCEQEILADRVTSRPFTLRDDLVATNQWSL